jgi:hypothetical protein
MTICPKCQVPISHADLPCPQCGDRIQLSAQPRQPPLPHPSLRLPTHDFDGGTPISPLVVEEIKERVRQRYEDRKVVRTLTVIAVLLAILVSGWGVSYAIRLRRVAQTNQEDWTQFQEREKAAQDAQVAAPDAHFEQQRLAERRISQSRTLPGGQNWSGAVPNQGRRGNVVENAPNPDPEDELRSVNLRRQAMGLEPLSRSEYAEMNRVVQIPLDQQQASARIIQAAMEAETAYGTLRDAINHEQPFGFEWNQWCRAYNQFFAVVQAAPPASLDDPGVRPYVAATERAKRQLPSYLPLTPRLFTNAAPNIAPWPGP